MELKLLKTDHRKSKFPVWSARN